MKTIFTIGHSSQTVERFIELLMMHSIEVVADVRSAPYSRRHPQFSRDELRAALGRAGIRYVFLGAELGARTKDPGCYVDGRASYDKIATTAAFREGLDRVMSGARTYRVVLMCAEKDPLDCHRTILVARHLVERGAEVQHILMDGQLEIHGESMVRLMRRLGLGAGDLFMEQDAILKEAYDRQGAKIAYVDPRAD
jgi:uncharacterized protein (DUF488 family)